MTTTEPGGLTHSEGISSSSVGKLPTPPATRVVPRLEGPLSVESECGAVAVGRTYLLPPLSSGGASLVRPWLRFHTPLIEPDTQISRIRLSDKTSRLFRV
jgi:hypothetical protein